MDTYFDKNIDFIKLRVASIKMEFECVNRKTYTLYRGYLSSFNTPDIVVEVTEAELKKRRNVVGMETSGTTTSVKTDSDVILEDSIIHEKVANAILTFNTFLMHGSVVAKDNYAYMFTAASGVGKTTRTRIFCDIYPDSLVVNGDKPFIKITETEVLACGTPWCGKEGWNTNAMVPLRAIFLLERADEIGENSIEEVSLGEAFPFLLQQTYRPEDPDLMRKTLALLKTLEGKVKIYKFRSTPAPDSVRLAYETARPR